MAVNLFGRTRRSDEEDKEMTPGLSVCTSVKILIITEYDYTLALRVLSLTQYISILKD